MKIINDLNEVKEFIRSTSATCDKKLNLIDRIDFAIALINDQQDTINVLRDALIKLQKYDKGDSFDD